ncbi:MAG: phage holin family protein [Gemmobacter sp.]|nr:phage holin family protein [Gemmobacter sp.]
MTPDGSPPLSTLDLAAEVLAAALQVADSEAAVIKAELAEARRRAVRGIILGAVAAAFAFFAIGVGLAAILLGLIALGLSPWLAALVIFAALVVVAAILLVLAQRLFTYVAQTPGRYLVRLSSLSQTIFSKGKPDA